MLHGRHRPFPRTGGASAALAGQSWQAAVIANGGTVSAGRLVIVNNFIAAEMAAGTWDLTDDYWGLWAEDTIGALVSLKQRRMGISVAAPSFTPDRGYVFNGTTNYLNTGFISGTHAVAMTGSNLRLAIYERTDLVAAGSCSAGAANSATQITQIFARTGTPSVVSRLNFSANITFTLAPATGLGYTAVSRNGGDAASCFAYKNGVALAQIVTAPTFSAVLPTFALFIGAHDNVGSPLNFRASSVGFFAAGAHLTPAQELAQYSNVQAWATAVGAQV